MPLLTHRVCVGFAPLGVEPYEAKGSRLPLANEFGWRLSKVLTPRYLAEDALSAGTEDSEEVSRRYHFSQPRKL